MAKVGGAEEILDVKSTKPLPAGSGYQSLMRSSGNHDRAANGIRDCLLQYPNTERGTALTVLFRGIGDCSPASWSAIVDSETPSYLETNGQPARIPEGIEQGASCLETTFLQSLGELLDRGELCDIDTRIGEGEMPAVQAVCEGRCTHRSIPTSRCSCSSLWAHGTYP